MTNISVSSRTLIRSIEEPAERHHSRRWAQRIAVFDDDTAELVLAHPDGRSGSHLFDADLADEVAALRWCQRPDGYANAWHAGAMTRLHWLVIGVGPGRGCSSAARHVDHQNGDRSDSRRSNLKLIPRRLNSHNLLNQSPFGPSIRLDDRCPANPFRVQVKFAGRRVFCPSLPTLVAATRVRDEYLTIAHDVDQRRRPAPSREELMLIADRWSS